MSASIPTITLKELRKSRGLSQKKLAELAGLSRSRVARLENGSWLTRLTACTQQLGGTLEVAVVDGEKRMILATPGAKKPAKG